MTPTDASRDATAVTSALRGLVFGLTAALFWAASMAFVRQGLNAGLLPSDILALRFTVSGIVLLPWLLRAGIGDLAGVGWARGLVLMLCAGLGFVFLGAAGYLFTPLSHGAVIQPATAALGGMIVGWLVLKERMTPARAVGTVLLIAGVSLIASRSLLNSDSLPMGWVGDLSFVGAGLCWVGFTAALKSWQIGPIAAAAIVAVLSGALVVPAFLLFDTPDRLLALSWPALGAQVLFQGFGAGILAIVAFARAVALLGAARAALFPGIVPALTLAVGIPVTGEIPSMIEIAGALLATLGLTVGLGAFDRRNV